MYNKEGGQRGLCLEEGASTISVSDGLDQLYSVHDKRRHKIQSDSTLVHPSRDSTTA